MITDSYKQLFLFFILLTLVSCRQQPESVAGVTTVRIEDFQDKVLETDDFLSDVRTLSLHDDSLGYIGQIKDVCAVDSFLYVLDGITASLTQFQIGAGKQMRSVCKRGNGPYEYIQPMALTADGPLCIGLAGHVYHCFGCYVARGEGDFTAISVHGFRQDG